MTSRASSSSAPPSPLQQAVEAGLPDVVRRLLDRSTPEALRATEPGMVVKALSGSTPDDETRLGRGHAVELLIQRGAPMPRLCEFVKDSAGRFIGVRLAPSAALSAQELHAAWPVFPLVSGAWRELDAAEMHALLSRCVEQSLFALHDLEHRHPLRARRLDVGFYDDACLYEIALAGSTEPRGTWVLVSVRGRLTRLEGKSNPIHDVNAAAPMHLHDAEQAKAYLVFFCAAVHGDEGAFRVLESIEFVDWSIGADPEVIDKVKAYCGQPVLLEELPEEEGFLFRCHLVYANALFEAKLVVHRKGNIEMAEDEPVLGDLPVRNERFLGGVRTLKARAAAPPGQPDAAAA